MAEINPSLGAQLDIRTKMGYYFTPHRLVAVRGIQFSGMTGAPSAACQTERFIRFSKKCLPCTLTLRIPGIKIAEEFIYPSQLMGGGHKSMDLPYQNV